jgi:4-hydroxy-tetrahydrodipicolinate synthase
MKYRPKGTETIELEGTIDMKVLTGAYTALVTPMKENGDVDYDGFRRSINFQLEQGIDGLVPLGSTGETPTLEEDEEE